MVKGVKVLRVPKKIYEKAKYLVLLGIEIVTVSYKKEKLCF
jgi:hypothetical protein